jgi:hypothetical protein
MKKVEITLNIDPMFFGTTDNYKTEAYAFNLNRNIQKIFNVNSDYRLVDTGNTYTVNSPDEPRLELEISEYIENNWHTSKKKN